MPEHRKTKKDIENRLQQLAALTKKSYRILETQHGKLNYYTLEVQLKDTKEWMPITEYETSSTMFTIVQTLIHYMDFVQKNS